MMSDESGINFLIHHSSLVFYHHRLGISQVKAYPFDVVLGLRAGGGDDDGDVTALGAGCGQPDPEQGGLDASPPEEGAGTGPAKFDDTLMDKHGSPPGRLIPDPGKNSGPRSA